LDLNDELLCAYLDDELDPVQRREVAAALAKDAGAQLRLKRMTSADHRLQNALAVPGEDHFHAAMAAKILNGTLVPRWRRAVLPWAAAAAVSGIFAGYLAASLSSEPVNDFGLASMGATQTQLLQQTRVGDADRGNFRVVLSFKAQDSRYCRVFRTNSQRGGGEGLACREPQGWRLVAWDATSQPTDESYRTAGASMIIDAAMNQLGGSAAFAADDEAQLIKRNWTDR
jgi:hypothetical protein